MSKDPLLTINIIDGNLDTIIHPTLLPDISIPVILDIEKVLLEFGHKLADERLRRLFSER